MPGLAVILGHPKLPGFTPALSHMMAPLSFDGRHGPHAGTVLEVPAMGVCAGSVAPQAIATSGRPAGRASSRSVSVLLEGEIFNLVELARGLTPARDARDACDSAAAVAELYVRDGAAVFAAFRGHWAAVVVDEDERQVVIANDTAGLRPLYHAATPTGLNLIASSPAALLAHPEICRTVDPDGLAEMLAFTVVLGSRTLFAGVSCLPPASIVTWQDGRIEQRRYWQLAVEPHVDNSPAGLERFRELFNESVLLATAAPGWPGPRGLALALSGGMDSRAVMSTLVANSVPLRTLTHAVEESTDARISAEVAHAARTEHHFYDVTGEALAGQLLAGARMLSGRVAALDVHPLCFLDDIADYAQAIITGMGGEVHKTVTSGSTVGATTTDPLALADAIYRSYNRALSVDTDFPQLLAPDLLATARVSPSQAVARVVTEAARSVPLSAVSGKIFFEERMRKVLPKGDILVRSRVETRHPLTAPELISAGISLSYAARSEGAPLRYVISRNAPALARVAFERDGRPIGYLDTPLARLQDGLARRWEHIQRRYHFGSPYRRVPSYRYGAWLRGPLAPIVRDVLLDPRTLARPYWRGETITRWVAEHMAGQDRTPQVSVLLALELALRCCIDAAPEADA